MKKKMMLLGISFAVLFSASAMVMGFTYQKIDDSDCDKCSITNDGVNRKCGKCGGWLDGGKAEIIDGNWLKATFTCTKCQHSSVWKYK